jgi:outer membrane protein OmpA-like peptidoglycan-associated protein
MKISAMKSTLLALFLSVSISACASSYVVIGAFANKSNAVRLAKRFPKATYDINQVKQLYYVFVLKTEDHEEALAEARRLQSQTKYKDAWVFSGLLGKGGYGVDVMVSKEEPVIEKEPDPVKTEPVKTEPLAEAPREKRNNARDPKVNIKDFYFEVLKEDSSKADGAEIAVVDPQTKRKELTFKGNENVSVKAINQSGDMRFECDLAGYRQNVQTINFKDPSTTEGVRIEDDRIIVPFNLVRLKKGDVAILYNVFFYKDAAIMRPESKFDLDGVQKMMEDNPKYKIRIHGHTNGNAAGRILERGDGSKGEYFSLSGAKEGSGSAKKLSQKRAEVIRDYLIAQGIAPDRMVTRAWGGKKPLYDKLTPQASGNVRVEVEVIEE